VTKERGRFIAIKWTECFMATVHPSSLLRARIEDREEEIQQLVADLRKVAERLQAGS
jgi:uracil-DNA glycosylase